MLTGKVSIIKMGLIRVFKIPRTTDAIRADVKLSIFIPGTMLAVT